MSPLSPRESPRIVDKSPDAFRTISEVAEDLDLPQHVLRFWETRFPQIKPLKRGGGRRYYRPEDVDLLKGIRQLLYGEGYTIKGVQRILKEDGVRFVQSIGRGEQAVEAPPPGQRQEPEAVDHESNPDAPADEGAALYRSPEASGSHSAPLPELQTAPPATPKPALSIADIARLRSALKDLLECERVLEALRARRSGEDDQLADG